MMIKDYRYLYLLVPLILGLAFILGNYWNFPFFVIGDKAKITLHLVTDDGKTLNNFPCSAGSTVGNLLLNAALTVNVEGRTDGNGNITFRLPSVLPEVVVGTKYGTTGYYPSGIKYSFNNTVLGKWQPWNPTEEMVVKPILNPIPMYAKAVRLTIPSKETPVGFDLEAGDWVAPYGKGTVSDFVFTVTEKVPFVRASQPYDVTQTLSFSNKGDGIQSVLLPQNGGSALRLPRNSPEAGYQPTLPQELSLVGNKRLNGADGEVQNYFFRIRTVLDEQWNIKSALYGKIAGPIECGAQGYIQFTYYLNPTPNDRNMEFDPSKNLFQNLPSLQQVNAP
jgi:hypothetical protein